MLGGAWPCLHSSPPCGLRARGRWLVLVGRAYARVHEWCFGRVRWQAPCSRIDLLSHKAPHFRVRQLVPRTALPWLLCWLPTVRQLIDVWSPHPLRWPHGLIGGALSCPRVPSALLPCGAASAREVLPYSRVQYPFVVSRCSFIGCPSCDRYHRQMTLVVRPVRRCPRCLRGARATTSLRDVTWLILPVVICLSQRLSHACVSMN